MPLWIPVLVLILAAAVIVFSEGGFPGTPEFVVTVLAWVTMMAAVGVLGLRLRGTPPVWAQWLLLAGPTMLTTAVGVLASIRGGQDRSAAVATCRRCGCQLLADHTGRRFYALSGGYLCPTELRQPGDRRHHVELLDPAGHVQQPGQDIPG
jgi:hypothetical protein